MGVTDPKHVDELVGLLRQSSMFHACSKDTLVKVRVSHCGSFHGRSGAAPVRSWPARRAKLSTSVRGDIRRGWG